MEWQCDPSMTKLQPESGSLYTQHFPPPGSGGAMALWSCSSESLPVKHLTFKTWGGGALEVGETCVRGRHMLLHSPHPPDPHNPTHPLLLHPHSSLLTHADRIRGITEDLNNLTVQVLSPGSDTACFCLCSHMNVAVTLCTDYQGILFVLLFMAMHAWPCDWAVHLFQIGLAWIPFYKLRIFACISKRITEYSLLQKDNNYVL